MGRVACQPTGSRLTAMMRSEIVDFSDGYINVDQRLMVPQGRRLASATVPVSPPWISCWELRSAPPATTQASIWPTNPTRVMPFEEFGFVVQSLIACDDRCRHHRRDCRAGHHRSRTPTRSTWIGESLSTDQLGFIFREGSKWLEPIIEALAGMTADGTLRPEISSRYFDGAFSITYDDLDWPEYEGESPEPSTSVPSSAGGLATDTAPIPCSAEHLSVRSLRRTRRGRTRSFNPGVGAADSSAESFPYWAVLLALIDELAGLAVAAAPQRYRDAWDNIAVGIALKIRATAPAFAISLVLGLLLGSWAASCDNVVLRNVARTYIEFIRGVPMLPQIFFLALVVVQQRRTVGSASTIAASAPNGMARTRWPSIYGAYFAAVFRGGVQSVPRGQMEAGLSLDLSRRQPLRRVIFTQAMRAVHRLPLANGFNANSEGRVTAVGTGSSAQVTLNELGRTQRGVFGFVKTTSCWCSSTSASSWCKHSLSGDSSAKPPRGQTVCTTHSTRESWASGAPGSVRSNTASTRLCRAAEVLPNNQSDSQYVLSIFNPCRRANIRTRMSARRSGHSWLLAGPSSGPRAAPVTPGG